MENIQNVEHIAGTLGEVGAQRNLYFIHKKKEMKVIETIKEKSLPNHIKFTYDSPMGRNEVELLFEEIIGGKVKQTSNTQMEMKGIMKVLGVLFKGLFKKQSFKYMTNFKHYAEK